jgi:hypothetical protein
MSWPPGRRELIAAAVFLLAAVLVEWHRFEVPARRAGATREGRGAATARCAPDAALPEPLETFDCATELGRIELRVDRCDGQRRSFSAADAVEGAGRWSLSSKGLYRSPLRTLGISRRARSEARLDPKARVLHVPYWDVEVAFDPEEPERVYESTTPDAYVFIRSSDWSCPGTMQGRYHIVQFPRPEGAHDHLAVVFALRCPKTGERVAGCLWFNGRPQVDLTHDRPY